MSETRYAQYHRPGDELPDPAKLRALGDGYFGLSWVFVVNILLALPLGIFINTSEPANADEATKLALLYLAGVVVIFVTISTLTYFQNKKIGVGLDWSPALVIIVSILMGLNSALCCGVIGYAVVQTIASNKIKKVYGVKLGMFSTRKLINARVAELERLRAARASGQPPNFMP